MDNILPTNVSARNLWLRLSIPVLLALAMTTLILFLPVWAAPARPSGDNSDSLLAPWLDAFTVQAQGGLTITKSAVPVGTVDQGKFITYTLSVTNNTGGPLNSLLVEDDVPLNTSCLETDGGKIFPGTDTSGGAWTPDQASCDAGIARWIYLNLSGPAGNAFENGESVRLSFRVAVTAPLPNQSEITNGPGYEVSGSNILTQPPITSAGTTAVEHLVNAPDWAITKTASPSQTVKAGENLTYTITLTNVGDLATAGPFTVTETLPQHTSYQAATEPVTQSGTTLTWVRSGLAVDASLAFTVVVKVDSPITNGTKIINNSYQVSGGAVYTDPVAGQPVTVTVDSPVTLTVKKAAAATVQAGDLLTYTIAITNDAASSGEAAGLVFTDAIPANTVYVGHGFSGAIVGGTPAAGSSVVTWTLSKLDIGQTAQLTLTVRAQSPLTNGTVLTNSQYGATLSNTLFLDPPVPVTTTVASAPIITMSKTVAPTTVVRGQQVTYTITITNSGNETAVSLPFTDAVSAPDFDPPQATWTRTITGKKLDGTVGVVNYTLVMTAGNTPGQFGNYLTTTVRGVDIAIGPVATVTVRPPVDLQISKARLGSADVVRGDLITYTLTITNAGPETTNARITDTFTNATYSKHVAPYAGTTCSSTTPLVCNIPALTGTTTITVVLATSGSVSGTITNTAVITNATPNQGDADDTNNSDTVITPVRYPVADLQISKARLGSGELLAGDSITYTLTITNAAGSDTVDAVVTDTFTTSGSGSVTVGSATASGGNSCGSTNPIVCQFNNFTNTQTITVVLNTSGSFSGTLTNTAKISFAASQVAVEANPADNVTAPVVATGRLPIADLQLSKTRVGSGQVVAGGSITYTLTITNAGPDTVDAVVTDTFTGTVASISSNTTRGDICTDTASPIVCSFNGFTNTETITVVLQTSNSFSGTLTNTARIAATVSGTVDPPGNNSDSVTTSVRQLSADLQISKTGPGFATAGDAITYTLVITNAGDAVDVVVTDTFNYGSYQSVSPSGSCSGSGPIVCQFDDFAGTQVITVVLSTNNASSDNTLINTATIATPLPNAIDPNPANNSDYQTTIVSRRRADLQIEKTLVGSSPVQAGERITYTVRITNTGPDVVGANLYDQVSSSPTSPAAITGIGISAPTGWSCIPGFSTISCNTSQFNLISQTFTVVVTTSAAFSGTLTNYADVTPTSPAFDPTPDDNNDEVDVKVVLDLTPVLTITKTASPGAGSNVTPGGTIRYTLTVTNSGYGPASNVVITDDLTGVGGVGYVSGSGSSSGSLNQSGGLVTISQPSLAAGKALTATWEVTVTATTSGTALSNYANAASAGTPVITSNLVAHTVITRPPPGPVFLPFISKNCCFANLVITDFSVDTTVNPPTVSVEVTNQGLGSTGGGFWVDLYVNPNPLPVSLLNATNPGDRRWQRLRTNVDQGIAWEIKTALAPGASIVLTQSSSQVNLTQTKWTALPAGEHKFYAFADSYDADNNRYVQINEGSDPNELDNQAGPETSTVPPASAGSIDTASQPAGDVPPRRDAGQ